MVIACDTTHEQIADIYLEGTWNDSMQCLMIYNNEAMEAIDGFLD